MSKSKGFTLIELVVVIVILGILSVAAAPKFLDLQVDARNSALSGLKGAMHGASGIVYGKSAIDGVESIEFGEEIDGIAVSFGYPTADAMGIGEAVEGLDSDWKEVNTDDTNTDTVHYSFTNSEDTVSNCYVTYSRPMVAGESPIITVTECDNSSPVL